MIGILPDMCCYIQLNISKNICPESYNIHSEDRRIGLYVLLHLALHIKEDRPLKLLVVVLHSPTWTYCVDMCYHIPL